MRYVVVIHKDEDSDYGVTVPDMAGCFSVGRTIEEALENVVEAIECHLEAMMFDGEKIPENLTIEHHRKNPDYTEGIWGIVEVKPENLKVKIAA
ncbi:MAG: type II toxin-antitoxin system HicB family antitoxin [Acidobacteriota bacterium]|nr:type II toxin-antitoxin system HicB family antitoxin [Acidobacteriota bacterium]